MKILAVQNKHDVDTVELYSYPGQKYMLAAIHIDHFYDSDDNSISKPLGEGEEVVLNITLSEED